MIAPWWQDRAFAAALVAGPAAWAALSLVQAPGSGLGGSQMDIAAFLLVVLVLPVGEELAFRGWLQGALWKTRLSQYSATVLSGPNLITSAAFATLHLIAHPPIWAAAVFLPSMVFGYFRDRCNSVLPGILLHGFYNAGYFLLYPL